MPARISTMSSSMLKRSSAPIAASVTMRMLARATLCGRAWMGAARSVAPAPVMFCGVKVSAGVTVRARTLVLSEMPAQGRIFRYLLGGHP